VESLARVICEYSLRVEPGQLMLIEAPALAEPLVLEIVTRALEMGALPRVRVAAEGTQLAFLGARRCDRIQGHLFSEPVPPEACEAFLARHRT